MNLEKDFMDFVELLNNYSVHYMVVGGYALAFHGEPRTTGDMDIWIDCNEHNAQKMVNVMNAFGKEDFIKNKEASSRKKDLADIKKIKPKRAHNAK